MYFAVLINCGLLLKNAKCSCIFIFLFICICVLSFPEFGAGEGRWHVRHHHQTRPLRRNKWWDAVWRIAILSCFSISSLCIISDVSLFRLYVCFICFPVKTYNQELCRGQICLSWKAKCLSLLLFCTFFMLILCVDNLTAQPLHKNAYYQKK